MDMSTGNLPLVHGWTLALNGQFNFHQKPIQSKATYSHISNIHVQNKHKKGKNCFLAQNQIHIYTFSFKRPLQGLLAKK